MKKLALLTLTLLFALLFALATAAQTPSPGYQPKSKNDPAHSQDEFTALAYMHTAVTAEKLYYRKHNRYPDSLLGLVGSGSFTRRMANPDRGAYKVGYRLRPDGYALTMTPPAIDPNHRAFYVDESGQFRVNETAQATDKSAPLK
jgi:hypothetical protein